MKNSPVITGLAWLICALIAGPILIVVAVSFTTERYVNFPPTGATLHWFSVALSNPRLIRAVFVSLEIAAFSSIAAVVLGLMVALNQHKMPPLIRNITTPIFLAPLTIPAIVLAIGLLFFLGSIGLLKTKWGLVIGHALITFPYAVRMILASIGRNLIPLQQAASVLGANRWQIFLRITVPQVSAGLFSSFLFVFLISMNYVTIALFIAGVRSETLPLLMFNMTINEVSPELAATATMFILFTLAVLLVLQKWFGINQVLERKN